MLCFGIDAALATTGWAAVEGTNTDDAALVGFGVIETKATESLFERVRHIRKAVVREVRAAAYRQGVGLESDALRVAIERTDYAPGRGDTRERWIREASAREALAFGLSAALLACDDLGIVPQLVGPNEWQCALGAQAARGKMKETVAELVAYQFPQVFVSEFVETRKRKTRGALPYQRAVLFADTRRVVPTHITDAAGLAYVALQRNVFAARLEAQGVDHAALNRDLSNSQFLDAYKHLGAEIEKVRQTRGRTRKQ